MVDKVFVRTSQTLNFKQDSSPVESYLFTLDDKSSAFITCLVFQESSAFITCLVFQESSAFITCLVFQESSAFITCLVFQESSAFITCLVFQESSAFIKCLVFQESSAFITCLVFQEWKGKVGREGTTWTSPMSVWDNNEVHAGLCVHFKQ